MRKVISSQLQAVLPETKAGLRVALEKQRLACNLIEGERYIPGKGQNSHDSGFHEGYLVEF